MKSLTYKFTSAFFQISSLNAHLMYTIRPNLHISKSKMQTFRFEGRKQIQLLYNNAALA